MMDPMSDWPFADAPNVAVFSSRKIVQDGEWVYYVSHDKDDGAWQFHPYSGLTSETDVAIVSLDSMVRLDETLKELSDLPLGWHAWRKSQSSPWERSPSE
jgi:hypothetical protein